MRWLVLLLLLLWLVDCLRQQEQTLPDDRDQSPPTSHNKQLDTTCPLEVTTCRCVCVFMIHNAPVFNKVTLSTSIDPLGRKKENERKREKEECEVTH